MSKPFQALSSRKLDSGVTYHRPPQRLPEHVSKNSPAVDVMTDLTKVSAVTIGPCASLDNANERMIASAVRLLLVADQRNQITGIITSSDLSGEKPMKYLQEVGGKREDIFVRDIMTPQSDIEVLYMVDVVNSRVGDIIATLKRVGRQHALVVDLNEDKQQVVRGIFSVKQLSKQIGITVETTEIAQTFAELEVALSA